MSESDSFAFRANRKPNKIILDTNVCIKCETDIKRITEKFRITSIAYVSKNT